MTDETTGVTEPAAEVHSGVMESDAETHAEPQVSDKDINFRAVRQELQDLKRQNEYLQMQIVQREASPQADDEFDLNKFRDDDIPTYGELKKLRQQEARERKSFQESVREMQVRSRHADYDEVVNGYLKDVLEQDPDLALAIKDSPKMYELAYKLAQSNPKYHQKRLAAQNQAAVDRIVDNASRPLPASSRKNVMVHDEESRMSAMSDEQILTMFNMSKARS